MPDEIKDFWRLYGVVADTKISIKALTVGFSRNSVSFECLFCRKWIFLAKKENIFIFDYFLSLNRGYTPIMTTFGIPLGHGLNNWQRDRVFVFDFSRYLVKPSLIRQFSRFNVSWHRVIFRFDTASSPKMSKLVRFSIRRGFSSKPSRWPTNGGQLVSCSNKHVPRLFARCNRSIIVDVLGSRSDGRTSVWVTCERENDARGWLTGFSARSEGFRDIFRSNLRKTARFSNKSFF